ncbi:MAG: diacylglycerol kinase family lipid kinase [Chitinophagales bacterium]
MNWSVIINPTAGGGKAEKQWHQKIAPLLQQKNIFHQTAFTQSAGHASKLTQQLIETGSRHILAVGGDGTFHEVANGIMNQTIVASTEITFAVIPVGTGNDWIRSLEIPSELEAAIHILQNGTTFLQDIGLVTFMNQYKEQEHRYFINVAGAGFDGYVAYRMGKSLKRFGQFTYFWELLKGIVSFQNIPIQLQSGSFQSDTPIFMLNVGIGKYLGSGMKVVPNAVLDDGLFDVTFIEKASKMEVLGQLNGLYDGSFIHFHKVKYFQTTQISIEATGKTLLYVQADGELLGFAPLQFEILPKMLKVLR